MKTRELFTVDEAAKAMSISPKTLRAWIANRRIGVVRPMGWAIRIPSTEIDRIIDDGSIPARTQ